MTGRCHVETISTTVALSSPQESQFLTLAVANVTKVCRELGVNAVYQPLDVRDEQAWMSFQSIEQFIRRLHPADSNGWNTPLPKGDGIRLTFDNDHLLCL